MWRTIYQWLPTLIITTDRKGNTRNVKVSAAPYGYTTEHAVSTVNLRTSCRIGGEYQGREDRTRCDSASEKCVLMGNVPNIVKSYNPASDKR